MVDFITLSYWTPPLLCLLIIVIYPRLLLNFTSIALYPILTIIFISITGYFLEKYGNNLFLFDYIPYFEFGTLGFYLCNRMRPQTVRPIAFILYLIIIIWYTLALFDFTIFSNSWLFLGNSNYGTFLLILSLIHYADLMILQPTSKLINYPYFWFTTAIFCYFGIGFFLLPFMSVKNLANDNSVIVLTELLHHIPNWLLYSFIFIGLWKARKTV